MSVQKQADCIWPDWFSTNVADSNEATNNQISQRKFSLILERIKTIRDPELGSPSLWLGLGQLCRDTYFSDGLCIGELLSLVLMFYPLNALLETFLLRVSVRTRNWHLTSKNSIIDRGVVLYSLILPILAIPGGITYYLF